MGCRRGRLGRFKYTFYFSCIGGSIGYSDLVLRSSFRYSFTNILNISSNVMIEGMSRENAERGAQSSAGHQQLARYFIEVSPVLCVR